jgi:hypothetical protein
MTRCAQLGLPGILAMSEWWFWEAVCFMAGEFGTAALAAHRCVLLLLLLPNDLKMICR